MKRSLLFACGVFAAVVGLVLIERPGPVQTLACGGASAASAKASAFSSTHGKCAGTAEQLVAVVE